MNVLGIIGPSGCGKTSVVSALHARGLIAVTPTVTDRPRRPGEKEFEHKFVTKEVFDELSEQDAFLEIVQPFGLKFRYGFPPLVSEPGKVSLAMIRANFIPLFFKHFPDSHIYQIEAHFTFAKKQLESRQDPWLGTRLSDFSNELGVGRTLADRVFNNDGQLEKLVDDVAQALVTDFSNIWSQTNGRRGN